MLQTTQNIPLQIRRRKLLKTEEDGMTWLRVPNSIVQMSGAFSVLQLRFLIAVIEYTQVFIKERERLKKDPNIRICFEFIPSFFSSLFRALEKIISSFSPR